MKSKELREHFLKFFEGKQHVRAPSSSLIPSNDDTVMFTNAGMMQFKEVFLGAKRLDFSRSCTVQKCLRAGGKHNDLENVGFTARHHTFFEMLGNFSFGDYFKQEAIAYAWEFCTDLLQLDPKRLWITVYEEDAESRKLWKKIANIPDERIVAKGDADNFWMMGDTGPCGPCSEIFYDHGDKVAGGPPGTAEEDGDRFVEIWNLVFMQFEKKSDGSMSNLPKPSVDTGMGIERISAVMQEVYSNYDIDSFVQLRNAACNLLPNADFKDPSTLVICDHLRACVFLAAEGIYPGNEGRNYVMRRILRRAARHAYSLGNRDTILAKLVPNLVAQMSDVYPELGASSLKITEAIETEERQFNVTLDQGIKALNQSIEQLSTKKLPGDVAFKLHDTYGFPVDLTADYLRGRGLGLDYEGFSKCMEEQKTRARSKRSVRKKFNLQIAEKGEFTGYEHLKTVGRVLKLFNEQGDEVELLRQKERGVAVLDKTCFYAESGGQVADYGNLISIDTDDLENRPEEAVNNHNFLAQVDDCQKEGEHYLHFLQIMMGSLRLDDVVMTKVDPERRQSIARNHSATHLLHAALKYSLGAQVEQRGSLVTDTYLRFDFSYPKALNSEQITAVEALVNEEILANSENVTQLMSYDKAIESGAIGMFGDKYEDTVRVLTIGDGFSKELCGGTHVQRTGDIGQFVITDQSSVQQGVRRIHAVTGREARVLLRQSVQTVTNLQQLLNCQDELEEKVIHLQKTVKRLEKERAQVAPSQAEYSFKQLGEFNVLIAKSQIEDAKQLRDLACNLRDSKPNAIVLLASLNEGRIHIIATVGKSVKGVSAKQWLAKILENWQWRGGGNDTLAQGGGAGDNKILQQVLSFAVAKYEQLTTG